MKEAYYMEGSLKYLCLSATGLFWKEIKLILTLSYVTKTNRRNHLWYCHSSRWTDGKLTYFLFCFWNTGAGNRTKWPLFIFAYKAGRKRRRMALSGERWLAFVTSPCTIHEFSWILQCCDTGNWTELACSLEEVVSYISCRSF